MNPNDKVNINAPVTINERPSEIRVPVQVNTPDIKVHIPPFPASLQLNITGWGNGPNGGGGGGGGGGCGCSCACGPPTVTAVCLNQGCTCGSQLVIICGTLFGTANKVMFGTVSAVFVVNSQCQITALVPPNVSGVVNVTVTTSMGTSATSTADTFTYLASPVILTITPNTSPLTGESGVVITGTGFTGVTSVTIGGIPVTSFVVNSDTQITATIPPMSAGQYNVAVSTGTCSNCSCCSCYVIYNSDAPLPRILQQNQGGANFTASNIGVANPLASGSLLFIAVDFFDNPPVTVPGSWTLISSEIWIDSTTSTHLTATYLADTNGPFTVTDAGAFTWACCEVSNVSGVDINGNMNSTGSLANASCAATSNFPDMALALFVTAETTFTGFSAPTGGFVSVTEQEWGGTYLFLYFLQLATVTSPSCDATVINGPLAWASQMVCLH
jgi:hypothetical protein